MSTIRFGPHALASKEDPKAAVEILIERSYGACEIDFEGGFWMSWDYAEQLGELAREADIALSVHAPIPAFLGHVQRGRRLNMAMGMLDHSAGVAARAAPR